MFENINKEIDKLISDNINANIPDLETIQRQLNQVMQNQNNEIIPEFEGYSPHEMQTIIYDVFGKNSHIQLMDLSEADYLKIPILNNIKYLANIIKEQNEVKLTVKGNLPIKVVKELYAQRFMIDSIFGHEKEAPKKEDDSMSISLSRFLLELSGIAKKRANKLSLTKKGETVITDNNKLLKLVLETFGSKYNWSSYDGYGDNGLAQMGFGFSLILLSKYGNKKRPDSFYAEKYYNAFPVVVENFECGDINEYKSRCYSLRTFERFLDYFGIIRIEDGEDRRSPKFITKNEIFDKLIKIIPHCIK